MKNSCRVLAIVCVGLAFQISAKKEDPNFSLKNKSDRVIFFGLKDKNNKKFVENDAIRIEVGGEHKSFFRNITDIGSLTVGYCDPASLGPKYAKLDKNSACFCEDEFDLKCQENKLNLTYHTVYFKGIDDEIKNFFLKFSLEGGKPEVWAQEGRFGFLTPGRSKNIHNAAIVGNNRK